MGIVRDALREHALWDNTVVGEGTPCHGLLAFINISPTLAELCGSSRRQGKV